MQRLNKKPVTYLNTAVIRKVLYMSKRTDGCIERWWQGVGVGEVELTAVVMNTTISSTIWNFQKPAWNVREMSRILFWWLSILFGDKRHMGVNNLPRVVT